MGIVDNQFRTLSCEQCEKTVTFSLQEFQTPDGQKRILEADPWIRGYRISNMVMDGRVYGYCSSLCEIKGIESGAHEFVEKKVIEFPTGNNLDAIKRAAAEAAAKAEGTKALKEGRPVSIQPGS
jgi:hypothetical protein